MYILNDNNNDTYNRLECLRLASGLTTPDHVVVLADKFYSFLTGKDKPKPAPTKKKLKK